jgi:hypothetical protein
MTNLRRIQPKDSISNNPANFEFRAAMHIKHSIRENGTGHVKMSQVTFL